MATGSGTPDSKKSGRRGRQPHHRGDREVDFAADDHERHCQDDDRLLDAELKEVYLVTNSQEVRHPADVVGQHCKQDDEKEALQPRRRRMTSRAMNGNSFIGRLRPGLVATANSHPHLPQPGQDDGIGGDGDQDQQPQNGVFDEFTHPGPAQ